ncbi:hypothetical protein [Comamonas testosteroni]|nr:hypothetical protein [Comamonas testosteroni]
MNHPRLKQYPSNIPAHVDVRSFPSLVALLEQALNSMLRVPL